MSVWSWTDFRSSFVNSADCSNKKRKEFEFSWNSNYLSMLGKWISIHSQIGGSFPFVNDVLLFDERPFTYELFRLIAQTFPFFQRLIIQNYSKQKRQRSKRTKFITSIHFPRMTHLDLSEAHMDYVEQFLDHTKTSLFNAITLYVNYRCLQRVTQSFTRDTTRINCGQSNNSTHIIKTYFPQAENIE